MKSLIKALQVGVSRFAQKPDATWKTGTDEPKTTGIRAWLLRGTGYSSVSTKPSGEISIECLDDSWAKANASDLIANREAALETISRIRHTAQTNKSLAWPLVTCYYAAYFSAQSLLRCLGLGTVYLEPGEANLIGAAWSARAFKSSITASNYGLSVQLTTPTQMILRRLSSSGGAHQQFWTGFGQMQQAVHQVLLVSPALSNLSDSQRQAADVDYTKLISSCFNSSAAPTTQDFRWLANFRNDVNYRFGSNVWLMNWRHTSGLLSAQDTLIDRYLGNHKVLEENQRNFSKNHLTFVASRFCQLVRDGTNTLATP